MNGMNAMLKILFRVIERRMAEGEELKSILLDYPKLTPEEKTEIQNAMKG